MKSGCGVCLEVMVRLIRHRLISRTLTGTRLKSYALPRESLRGVPKIEGFNYKLRV